MIVLQDHQMQEDEEDEEDHHEVVTKEEGDHLEVMLKIEILERVNHKVKEDQRVQEVIRVLVDQE